NIPDEAAGRGREQDGEDDSLRIHVDALYEGHWDFNTDGRRSQALLISSRIIEDGRRRRMSAGRGRSRASIGARNPLLDSTERQSSLGGFSSDRRKLSSRLDSSASAAGPSIRS